MSVTLKETPLTQSEAGIEYKVIHRQQGRIRVNVPKLAFDANEVSLLTEAIKSLAFVIDVRINPAAKSIAVEYQPGWDSVEEKIISCCQSVSLSGILSGFNPRDTEFAAVDLTVPYQQMVGYQIVHRNLYRMRISIPRLAEDAEYADKLQRLLETLEWVSNFRINLKAKSLAVEFSYEATVTALATMESKVLAAIQQAHHLDIEDALLCPTAAKSHEIDYWERLGPSAISLGLSFGALIGLPFPGFLMTGAVLFAAVPVFQRAMAGIQTDKQLNIDFLDALAVTLHAYNNNFFAPSFMLGLIEGGEVIRDLTARGSERASLDLLDCLGKYARVERDGKEVEILVKEIIEGDRVVVYPGDQIPIDGYIVRGTGLIDQCKLTGESVPVTRMEGDEVFASTLLVDGQLCILTERTGSNTRAGIIVTLMQSAPVHDTRVENYAAMIANQAVVPTLLTGIGVGLASGDLSRAIALLTLDLGTGIRVSVPTTILSALTYAARNGVFIRSGRAIEILAKIDTVVFDKTGTLTQGHAGVTGIKVTDSQVAPAEILALAATAEQGLTHPVAEAIIRHAREQSVQLYTCEAWEYRVGLGVVATINGMQILVGSHRLMSQENISLDYLNQHYPDIKSGSSSLVYVAGDGKMLGVILYNDPSRPESKEVLQELQAEGIMPYMLSGDMTRVATAVAAELGINPNNVYAEAFPERKVEVVKSLHESGKTVAFCGDGINDSAALAYADVSISFAGATDIARETADVVLMEDDLRGLTHAIKIAKQAMEIIWQNTAIVAVPNLSAVVAGVLFALDPVVAIIINNGSAILAELNGLRPLLGPGGITPLSSSIDVARLAEVEQPFSEPEVELPQFVEDQLSPSPEVELPQFVEDQLSPSPEVELPQFVEDELSPSPELELPQIVVETPNLITEVLPTQRTSLNQRDLAQRFSLSYQTLSRRRSLPDFNSWSASKDPQGLVWNYDPASNYYYAAEHCELFAPASVKNQRQGKRRQVKSR